jgi:type II secretory pathway pseudopilin PulG
MCRTTPLSFVSDFNADGFSLVEVLVAIGILMTTAAAIPYLFTAAVRANADAGATTWATTLAAQKLEELQAQPLLEAVAGESIDYLDRAGELVPPGSPPRAYARRWWVEPLPLAPATTLVVTVAVSRHREGDGASNPLDTVRLVTLHTRTMP